MEKDGAKLQKRMETQLFLRLHWQSRMQKLVNWDRPVAIAAPAVPRSRPKIKIGSRKIFKIPPDAMPNMA